MYPLVSAARTQCVHSMRMSWWQTLTLPPGTRFHVFLTHDWGTDELGRPNHDRVKRVNAWLKQRGIVPWFDEEMMEGA